MEATLGNVLTNAQDDSTVMKDYVTSIAPVVISNKDAAAEANEKYNADPRTMITELITNADNARLPHISLWDANWALYNNQYDFSNKLPWQSQNYVPMVANIVRGIRYLMKQAMISAGDFFEMELNGIPKEDPEKDTKIGFCKKIIRQQLEKNNLSTVFSLAISTSLLESLLILKVIPNGNKGVNITALSPYDVRLDWTGRNRFKIHSIKTDIDLVIESAKAGVYDIAEVEKCNEDFKRKDEEWKEALRKNQEVQKPPSRREVIIDEFFGDWINTDGKIVMKNCTFSFLNEKYLIRSPLENPFEHKQCPIIVGAPNTKPKSVYHQAIISDINGLAVMVTEYLNLTLDASLMSILKNYEIDMDLVADPTDFNNGIYPGKVYTKKTKIGGVNAQLITEINSTGVNPIDLSIQSSLMNHVEQSVGWWNQFAQGTSKGSATATEVDYRSQMTSKGMQSIAEEIEDSVVVPMLEQTWSLMLQYFTDYDSLRSILPGPVIDQMKVIDQNAGKPIALRQMFGDVATFRARGISSVLAKQEQLNKVMQLANVMKMFPDALNYFEPYDLINTTVKAIGFSPTDIGLKPKDQVTREQQLQMQIMQMQQQMQMMAQQMNGGQNVQGQQ